jgi:pimeloyl-ACP methyl ester carboxylesterase
MRRAVVVLVAVAWLGAMAPATSRGRTDAATIHAAARPTAAIFLSGLSTSLSTGERYHSVFGPIAGFLRDHGVPESNLMSFGYGRAAFGPDGQWVPTPFGASATWTSTIQVDAENLDHQVADYLSANPNTDLYLVGHSQGGLIALAYLATLKVHGWTLPAGGRVGIVTLDAPLGGLGDPGPTPTLSLSNACGPDPSVFCPASVADMLALADPGTGSPAGATASIERAIFRISPGVSNQALADDAATHGIGVLALGNVQDHIYLSYGHTQWLVDETRRQTAVYARAIDSGPARCPITSCNHEAVLSDPTVKATLWAFMNGDPPLYQASCPPRMGDCLELPPGSRLGVVAAGIHAGTFRTGAYSSGHTIVVPAGSFATARFCPGRVFAGSSLPIKRATRNARNVWSGFKQVATRTVGSDGCAYYAGRIRGWVAFSTRFADPLAPSSVAASRAVTARAK